MTSTPNVGERIFELLSMIDTRLGEVAPRILENEPSRVRNSMRYSLLDGGKRIRPLLTLLTTDALGGNTAAAVDPACAIEMVHTASIIVDDLPCMDDALTRRGKSANHQVFGADIAILGSVALVAESFELMAKSDLDPAVSVALTASLARSIGVEGLCGGQERDLRETPIDLETLEHLQFEKTASLFVFCAEAGARVAGLDGDEIEPLRAFGRHAGLGFQTLDDLLDVIGTESSTGKDVHQDSDKLLDASTMRKQAKEHLDAAIAAVDKAGVDPAPFCAFLDFVSLAFEHQAVSKVRETSQDAEA